jgi:hypothetical protein
MPLQRPRRTSHATTQQKQFSAIVFDRIAQLGLQAVLDASDDEWHLVPLAPGADGGDGATGGRGNDSDGTGSDGDGVGGKRKRKKRMN